MLTAFEFLNDHNLHSYLSHPVSCMSASVYVLSDVCIRVCVCVYASPTSLPPPFSCLISASENVVMEIDLTRWGGFKPRL